MRVQKLERLLVDPRLDETTRDAVREAITLLEDVDAPDDLEPDSESDRVATPHLDEGGSDGWPHLDEGGSGGSPHFEEGSGSGGGDFI
jgi:hypothetical protein